MLTKTVGKGSLHTHTDGIEDKWGGASNEQKFNIIYDKTIRLQIRLANKLISSDSKKDSFDYHPSKYFSVDDITQDCNVLLWKLLQEYNTISYADFLRLYKSSIWNGVYKLNLKNSQIKKNFHIPADLEELDTKPSSDFDTQIKAIDEDWIRNGFRNFLKSVHITEKTEKDLTVYDSIVFPSKPLVDFCVERKKKKKNVKNFINRRSISLFLGVPDNHIMKSMKRLSERFKLYSSKEKGAGDTRKI
jgi:hypothetical protein